MTAPAANYEAVKHAEDCTHRCLALLALSACNTIGGVGEDISAGADTVAGML